MQGEFDHNVWLQKISIPPPWRELEIMERWGGGRGVVKDLGNSRGEVGQTINLISRCPLIQYGSKYRSTCSKIFSYLLSTHRSFTRENSSLNTCI